MPSWPWTFAILPAGNVAASKLDDNFNAAMFSAGSSTNGAVPTWNGVNGNQLNTGGLTVGTAASNLVQLDGSGKLPLSTIPTGIGAAQAYAVCDSAGTIIFSSNVSGVVRIGAGQYEVSFTAGPGSTNYVAVATQESPSAGQFATIIARGATKVTVGVTNVFTVAFNDGGFDVVCYW